MTSPTDIDARASQPGLPVQGYVLLASLGLFWGLNWPGMKVALGELPVWWFRSMSVAAAAVGLLAMAWLTRGRILPARAEVGPLLLCMLFNVLAWHLLTGYGVQLMPAGRASIIAFTMPVWAAILGTLILGEPMTRHKIAGLALGLGGLAVLIGPDLVVMQTAPVGALCMLGAAFVWAAGTIAFKRTQWQTPVFAILGWQFVAGTVLITIGAAALEPVPDLSALSTEAVIALAYLFALPMVYCQWAYFTVVRIFPTAIAAIGTLAVPVVGIYSSALILGEPVGWREFVSLVLIVGALVTVLVLPALAASGKRRAG